MVKLSDIELPLIYKNTLLFKAGEWKHLSFSKEVVDKSVKDTKWSSLSKRLYINHDNADKFGSWCGKVENVHSNQGAVYGDVEIWDADKALKLLHGGSPFAISADIEYQENEGNIDRVIFTGFALEYDPGVRDINMYLSDVVRNEMNNTFHARFSNIIEAKPETKPSEDDIKKTLDEINGKIDSLNTQSIERRLEKQNAKMEEDKKSSEPAVTEQPKEEVKQEPKPQAEVQAEPNPLESRVQELEAKLAEMSKPKETPKEEPKVEAQPEKVANEGTVVESKPVESKPTIQMDESLMNNMVEKIAEKMKPQPMTVNEFGGIPKDPEEETIDRLAESLAN